MRNRRFELYFVRIVCGSFCFVWCHFFLLQKFVTNYWNYGFYSEFVKTNSDGFNFFIFAKIYWKWQNKQQWIFIKSTHTHSRQYGTRHFRWNIMNKCVYNRKISKSTQFISMVVEHIYVNSNSICFQNIETALFLLFRIKIIWAIK